MTQVFFFETSETFKNIYFEEHLRTTAFVLNKRSEMMSKFRHLNKFLLKKTLKRISHLMHSLIPGLKK